MADSDGEFVADGMSDDDIMDHRVSNHDHERTRGGKASKRRRKRDCNASQAWEQSKRTWETNLPDEDDDGMLSLKMLEAKRRRWFLQDTTPLQRGIIRHVMLVLDMSFAMAEKDMLPTRYHVTLSYASAFVKEFFEQNPISQLGIVGMRDGVAFRISDLGGDPSEHIERLHTVENQEPQGNPSLQNALEMCRGTLFHVPSHGTREVLIVYSALLSSDPGDIHETIGKLITDRIQVSVVGLSAQVAICADLCSRTNAGDESHYTVALDDVHFRELFLAATTPPVTRTAEQSTASLLMMGFPSRTLAPGGAATLCACHSKPCAESHACTRCAAPVCHLPAECPACGLTLILSTHLARSYHHLFPLRNWVEVSWADASRSFACFGCAMPFPEAPARLPTEKRDEDSGNSPPAPTKGRDGGSGGGSNKMMIMTPHKPRHKKKKKKQQRPLKAIQTASESGRYGCEVCENHFCIDCDVFAHEVTHNCPGCQSGNNKAPYAIENDMNGTRLANGHAMDIGP